MNRQAVFHSELSSRQDWPNLSLGVSAGSAAVSADEWDDLVLVSIEHGDIEDAECHWSYEVVHLDPINARLAARALLSAADRAEDARDARSLAAELTERATSA